jgi:aarF domain-containing kinase
MKGFNFASAFARPRWTCRQCRDLGLRAPKLQRGYSEYGYERPRRKHQVLLAAAATGTIGATALAFGDDVKHAYEATERTGRVITTLAVCINE